MTWILNQYPKNLKYDTKQQSSHHIIKIFDSIPKGIHLIVNFLKCELLVHGGVNEGRLFGRVWYGTEGFKNVTLSNGLYNCFTRV